MGESFLKLPTTSGWCVSWYTGVVRERTMRNGTVKRERLTHMYTSKSKAAVEAKRAALEAAGYEIRFLTECIF